MEQRIRRRAAGKQVRHLDLFLDRPADRRAIAKIKELWNQEFNGLNAMKNCWEVCEDCFRIRRKKNRKSECHEGHLVWSASTLKETYSLQNFRDLMYILESMRKDRTGEDGLGFQMPNIPRSKKNTTKRKIRERQEMISEKLHEDMGADSADGDK